MEQELIKKKREIITHFLEKGILVSSEILDEIKSYEQGYMIFEELKAKNIDQTVIDVNLRSLIQTAEPPKAEQKPIGKHGKDNIKIIFS